MLRKLVKFLSKNSFECLWVLLCILYPFRVEGEDIVAILDVGQGDSVLIQQDNFQILIDGGPDLSVLYSLPKYMPLGDREIEVFILTHPHDDHIYGLLEVMKRYSVKELWLYPVCFDNTNYEQLLDSDIEIKYVNSGLEFALGDIYLDILWPDVGKEAVCSVGLYDSWDGNINNDSVVIYLDYIGKKFLFMGDAEMPVEKALYGKMRRYSDIDVLKVGHHCSKTSTSETMLDILRPSTAICSSSRLNKFGHPDRGTISKLLKFRVQIFKTYESGDVVFGRG